MARKSFSLIKRPRLMLLPAPTSSNRPQNNRLTTREKTMTDNNKSPATATRRDFLRRSALGGAGSAAMLAGLNSAASAQSSEPVIIGAPLPVTGAIAADGIEFQRGLEMAAAEINELGGILGRPIELSVEDTASGGDDLISSAAQRLVDRSNA